MTDLVLFENLDLEIMTGYRVGIIGPNGTGKSTLLKLALDKMKPTAGTITLKNTLSVGYLDQGGVELNDEHTVLQEANLAPPS